VNNLPKVVTQLLLRVGFEPHDLSIASPTLYPVAPSTLARPVACNNSEYIYVYCSMVSRQDWWGQSSTRSETSRLQCPATQEDMLSKWISRYSDSCACVLLKV